MIEFGAEALAYGGSSRQIFFIDYSFSDIKINFRICC